MGKEEENYNNLIHKLTEDEKTTYEANKRYSESISGFLNDKTSNKVFEKPVVKNSEINNVANPKVSVLTDRNKQKNETLNTLKDIAFAMLAYRFVKRRIRNILKNDSK